MTQVQTDFGDDIWCTHSKNITRTLLTLCAIENWMPRKCIVQKIYENLSGKSRKKIHLLCVKNHLENDLGSNRLTLYTFLLRSALNSIFVIENTLWQTSWQIGYLYRIPGNPRKKHCFLFCWKKAYIIAIVQYIHTYLFYSGI